MAKALSQHWSPVRIHETLFTGEKLQVASDGDTAYTLLNQQLVSFSITKWQIIEKLQEDIQCFTLDKNSIPITFGSDGIIRHWLENPLMWRADAFANLLEIHSSNSLLLAGCSDGSLRVYQLGQNYLTHCFKSHKGAILSAKFHPKLLQIVSSGQDYNIFVHDLIEYKQTVKISVDYLVRQLAFTEKSIIGYKNGQIIKWSMKKNQKLSELSIEEDLTQMVQVGKKLFIGDDKGKISLLSPASLTLKKETQLDDFTITTICEVPNTKMIIAIDSDFNFFLLSHKLKIINQKTTNFDEIIDLRYIQQTHSILIATNSQEARLIDLDSFDTKTLKGHNDIILCLDVYEDYTVTGSKDLTVRLWHKHTPIAVYLGHTQNINAVAFGRSKFIVSGGFDQTLKLWDFAEGEISNSRKTCIAHLKEIISIKVSPNNKIIATGSHDKTIKLWSNKLKPIRTLEGHRRGIWDLAFCKFDSLLASASGDLLIKLWNLKDFSCVRTFENLNNSAVKVCFISSGIISASGDGLLKIWNPNTGTAIATLEQHEDKVWGLDSYEYNNKLHFISGSADGKLVIWKDSSLEESQQRKEEMQLKVNQDLQLDENIRQGNKIKAGELAFEMNRIQKLYEIIQTMSDTEITTFTDKVIISEESINKLLTFVRDWNTQRKYSSLAQRLLSEILDRVELDAFPNAQDIIRSAISNE